MLHVTVRPLAALVVLAFLAGAPLAQESGDSQQSGAVPTFRSGVVAVQTSVIVTDANGNPVSGLTADDFEIIENKIPRPITTFAPIDIPIEPPERTLGEPDVLGNDRPPGRVYLFALDQMSAELALRTRFVLRQFIEKFFGPNDTAAVVLTIRGPKESGHEFTSNPRLLLEAIDKFGGGDSMGGWEREKNLSLDLQNLLRVIATVPGGRKAVIYVSTGFNCRDANHPFCMDPYTLMEYHRPVLGGLFTDINPAFQDAMSFATRNNIAFYPINPQGLTTEFGGLDERLELNGLAELTGGFATIGTNNILPAFERIVRENSTYSVLGFDSTSDARDGRYMDLQVRVKRPGLQIRSLAGYVAPRSRREERRVPSTVSAAVWDAVASPMTTSGVPMRMYAAPFKAGGKLATVAITLEIQATRLNLVERDGAYRGELEILFAMTDSKNRKHPIYRHRADVALKPDTYERVSHSALRVLSQLTLPEGRYQLRASAGGAALAGSVVYDLVIPDFRDDFEMSGIALMSEQTSRTFTVSPHQKLDVDFPEPPTTAREFSRDDAVTVFAEVYENRRKPHTVTFAVDLRSESGTVVGAYSTERAATGKPKETSVYRFAPSLTLETVPPGRYTLHVDARSSLDGKKHQTRDIPIAVR
jgi:VWFA-related protein